MTGNPDINVVMDLVLKEAEERRMTAGMNGEWSDRGASALEDQVKFYRHGMRRTVPTEWKKHVQKAIQEADPEWSDYQRLKKKFGN